MKIVFSILSALFACALARPAGAQATVYYSTRDVLADFFRTSQSVTYQKVALDGPTRDRLARRLGYAPPRPAYTFYVARSGTRVLKFFLHVSREEQRRRLLDRLEQPSKRWKFSMQDIAERKLWDKYMAAYEDMIRATSRPDAPWYVVPADHKRFARLVVANAMVEALEGLDFQIPKVEGKALKEMEQMRLALAAVAKNM